VVFWSHFVVLIKPDFHVQQTSFRGWLINIQVRLNEHSKV
jgi:hypothetical protein